MLGLKYLQKWWTGIYFYWDFESQKVHNIIGCMYQHLSMDLNNFNLSYLNNLLDKVSKEQPSKHSPWWRRLSSSSSRHVLKTSWRRLDQDEFVHLSLMSSEDVFKTSSRRLGENQYIRLGYTSSRRLQDVLRRLQDAFKTSSRHLQEVSSS